MLAGEMEHFRLSFLAVTETHLSGEGEMVLDESRGHCMMFSGRKMGSQGKEWDSISFGMRGRL